MPRIPDEFLQCAIYLYPSVRAAEQGESAGGSGFLVHVASNNPGWGFVYAVTNSHVIREGASSVVRMNTKDGRLAVLEVEVDRWTHHPEGDDLAVTPIPLTSAHNYMAIDRSTWFVTPQFMVEKHVGLGDEVFMVGRFVNHEGRQTNAPSVRFGAIAQMNREPIRHPRGFDQESFLVEARSLPGYSGSPVFLYIAPFSSHPTQRGISGRWTIRLLGVDWSHINHALQVLDGAGKPPSDERGQAAGLHVNTNTGMMGVIPAWRLSRLLDDDGLVAERRRYDEEIAKGDFPRTA